MSYRPYFSSGIAALMLAACWTTPAAAGLILSFDSATYATRPGGSVAVSVFVSQVAGGAQVGVGNELLSGSIELSFATTGPATITSATQIAFGSAWDTGFASMATSSGNTLYDVSLLSINGIANLTSRLLLATFTFTSTGPGTQTIRVTQQDPISADFITAGGNVVDPTNTASATITTTPSAVPEPGSVVLLGLATLLGGPVARRYSTRRKR